MNDLPEFTMPERVAAARTARRALEHALSEVKTDAQADQVLRDLQRIAGQRTVAEETGREDLPVPTPGAARAVNEAIRRACEDAPAGGQTQAIIAAAARRMAADPPIFGGPLDESVLQATNPEAAGTDRSRLDPNRRRLRRALVKQLRPVNAIDAALFLDINGLPHPRWANSAMRWLTILMRGAHALTAGVFVAAVCQPRRGARVLADTLPALWIATAVIELPVKKFFRRRRPFIDIVRAVVVGRRPSSFSFPSGHSAAAFAGATLLRRHYPRWTAAFYLLAVAVGFSRVYLGAHYPGDVVTGGVGGTILAETSRAVLRRPGRWLAAALYPVLRFVRWLVW